MTPSIVVIGNINVDLIMGSHDRWPELGTEMLLDRMELRIGGSAGNSLVALRDLGATCSAIANVGTDAFGGWLRAQLVDVQGLWDTPNAPTSVTVALSHVSGERTFFSHLGHLAALSLEDVLDRLHVVRPGDIVLLVGAFLTPRLREQYPTLLAALKERRALVALDPGWPSEGWSHDVRAEVRSWLASCDFALLNDAELTALAERDNVLAAIEVLGPILPANGTLVVKCGSAGAVSYQAGVREQVDAPLVEVVDTVGAGDTFNAAYLHALAEGATKADALRTGVGVASLAISTFPRQYAPPSPPPHSASDASATLNSTQ
ncbi:carbohydrate kinase family protein [Deinococcus yavapaiensis]|uniref:Ribokinase n=1 Tax=Deinococcus yavapaiensis KR-236 TaxID=694435 RepID=A0A318SDF0_9DEIO|nr:carbohydrate kinase family protein [Deinococcus yavapaiensis]PYE50418.1 ribokinase [Deinococcus yavapaiensis KR-236]